MSSTTNPSPETTDAGDTSHRRFDHYLCVSLDAVDSSLPDSIASRWRSAATGESGGPTMPMSTAQPPGDAGASPTPHSTDDGDLDPTASTGRLVLVDGGHATADTRAPVSEAYTSPHFRRKIAYATTCGQTARVVTAPYGLCSLSAEIMPPAISIEDYPLDPADRSWYETLDEWQASIEENLRSLIDRSRLRTDEAPLVDIVLLCRDTTLNHLDDVLETLIDEYDLSIHTPFEATSGTDQIDWLDDHLSRTGDESGAENDTMHMTSDDTDVVTNGDTPACSTDSVDAQFTTAATYTGDEL